MKITKRIVSLIGAATLTASVLTVCATANTVTATLDGCNVSGTSSITKNTAKCTTTSGSESATLQVTATYTYYDTKAGLVKEMTDTKGWHGPEVSVDFSVNYSDGLGSISVAATHKAWYNGQSWTANTSARY